MAEFDKQSTAKQAWQNWVLRFIPYVVLILALVILPPFFPLYVQSLLTKIFIFAIFAMSLDLLWGYTGLISLGHAIYFGVGGYTVGILMFRYAINSFWIAAPAGIVMAILVAAGFGLIALRLSGAYFLLITFALGQLCFSLAWKIRWLSSPGMEGITGISLPDIGIPGFSWTSISFYYFVLIAFGVSFFILRRLVNSPFGYALRAIRSRKSRASALGYNTWLFEYISFIIGGAFAALAGVLFVYHNGIIVPEHLALGYSGLVLVTVILGGVGTLYGPVFGAAILILVEFYIAMLTPQRWPLILGSAFVITIMYAKHGIGVYVVKLWKRLVARYGSTQG